MSDWGVDATWTLFLDRDGVINKRNFDGYITEVESFEFLPGVPNAIASLSKIFHRVIVVTNQQGIGKGLMTERNLLEIHTYMTNEVYTAGGKIDKCYFAPNLKGAEDDMRKPGPAMAELAKIEFPEIEFSRCVMVGDTDSDILFGKNLGMKTVRVLSKEKVEVPADMEVEGLHELVTKLTHEK
ncbi:MAG: phosphatase [Fluviicola sp. XM-24bin1]|nr:MAG: phosphatase [Fluviicola sp. XM-24bin1]